MAVEAEQSSLASAPLASGSPADPGLIKLIAVFALGLNFDFLAGAIFAGNATTQYQLWREDVWLLSAQLLLVGVALIPLGKRALPLRISRAGLLLLAMALVPFCYFGTRWLLFGFDLSRDEQMADFDAWIFAHGRLAWPLPPEWRSEAYALNLNFMLPASRPVAWVSSYLPMNAAIRALVGLFADRALTGPLYVGLSLPLLWGCARRLWPEDREAATVSVLLLATSGQFLFMGMTAFAMSGHLFFNLLWLWLFLMNRRVADLAALVVGFVATGLHQPLFHPLFIAPFLLLLLRDRQWRRLALFVVGYGAICAFWFLWPHLMQPLVAGARSGGAESGGGYVSRLFSALSQNQGHIGFMTANLLRFCTWQQIFMLPLLLASWGVLRKNRIAGALALGFVLPIVVLAVILPWQGNGFGYRYLHGVLGNAALLGGYGWRRLDDWHPRLRPVFLRGTLGSAVILLPLQAWMARQYYAPFAKASAQIDASGADYAIIGPYPPLFTPDLVINRPDLSNRPIRLLAQTIQDVDGLARRICRPGVRVAFSTNDLFEPMIAAYGVTGRSNSGAWLPVMKAKFERANCGVILLR
jgi:hypothetical protein